MKANLSYPEVLPINATNVITIEYDMEDGCLFYGDVKEKTIFRQCLNGSDVQILVTKTETVEGKKVDFIFRKYIDSISESPFIFRIDILNMAEFPKNGVRTDMQWLIRTNPKICY